MSVKRIAERLLGNERGQTATEYMLIIAVVVMGAVAAASYFIPKFKASTETVATKVDEMMTGAADAAKKDTQGASGPVGP
ncbi:MAG: hypothetical protein ABIE74_01695 [Pseudomonadota bacterium]